MIDRVGELNMFRFAQFAATGVTHGVSTRFGGVSPPPYDTLNLSLSVPDEPARVLENRRRFATALGADPERMISSRQVHGDDVLVVTNAFDTAAPLPTADVQVTNCPGWLLTLRFADCVPLLMVHPERRAVAAVHAGWRGTLRRAARAAVDAVADRFGAEPSGLFVGIGPSIGPCCYEVGEEVAEHFRQWPGGVRRDATAPPRLDLWELNRQTVLAAGVPPEQIELAELCTRCRSDIFFSHRAQGYPAGRFSAAIGLT